MGCDWTTTMRESTGDPRSGVRQTLADVTLVLPIVPVAKGRPKARVRWMRGPDGKPTPAGAQAYTPQKTRSFEASVADMAAERLGGRILEGPLQVDILCVLQRPKRLLRRRDPEGIVWAPTKPDRDNLEKAVLDGLSACMRADSQVVAGETLKVHAEKTGTPRVVIRLRELGAGSVQGSDPARLATQLGLMGGTNG